MNTTTQHTPGPWHNNGTQVYSETSGRTVAVLVGVRTDQMSDEDRANVRLIAAAPELLRTLTIILDAFISAVGPADVSAEITYAVRDANNAVREVEGEWRK